MRIIKKLKKAIYMPEEASRNRLRAIIDVVCDPEQSPTAQRKHMVSHYLEQMQGATRTVPARTQIGRAIAFVHNQAREGLKAGEVPPFLEVFEQEMCRLCGKPIRFANIGLAYCDQGHQFGMDYSVTSSLLNPLI